MTQRAILTRQDIREALGRLPRVSLAFKPTPLEECTRLSGVLGGPRILFKRDDLTGLGLGGNKVRHMEFCMGEALSRGADVSVNANLWVSNNSRIIAAASRKVGMDCVLVVPGGKGKGPQGNMLINYLLGAQVHLLDTEDADAVDRRLREVAEDLRRAGRKPYVHNFEPMSRFSGAIAYLEASLELAEQLETAGVERAHIYMVVGASYAGMRLAAKALDLPWRIKGVMVATVEEYRADTLGWGNQAAEHLGLPLRLTQEDLDVTDEYIGTGYTVTTPECLEAMRLVAREEAILLEPIYTAKAMAALIEDVRQGRLGPRDTVVFVHTGGLPGLFLYERELAGESLADP